MKTIAKVATVDALVSMSALFLVIFMPFFVFIVPCIFQGGCLVF